jgi:hypothetical protein
MSSDKKFDSEKKSKDKGKKEKRENHRKKRARKKKYLKVCRYCSRGSRGFKEEYIEVQEGELFDTLLAETVDELDVEEDELRPKLILGTLYRT